MGAFWGRGSDGGLLHFLVAEQLLFRIYDRAQAPIEEGDVVLDIGGHLGVFTRLALDRGAERVVVFEPDPTNIACLKRTFRDELDSGAVILIEAAAWDSESVLELHVAPSYNSGMGTIAGARPGLDRQDEKSTKLLVRAAPIDGVVEELGLPRVDFIKMDIEGAERHALAGAERTISEYAPRMAICVYHRSDDPAVVPRIVLGFHGSYNSDRHGGQMFFF